MTAVLGPASPQSSRPEIEKGIPPQKTWVLGKALRVRITLQIGIRRQRDILYDGAKGSSPGVLAHQRSPPPFSLSPPPEPPGFCEER